MAVLDGGLCDNDYVCNVCVDFCVSMVIVVVVEDPYHFDCNYNDRFHFQFL